MCVCRVSIGDCVCVCVGGVETETGAGHHLHCVRQISKVSGSRLSV